VFIVVALGASGAMLLPAAAGAALALLMVVLLGLVLRRPLSRVPENALKFGVGAMLSGFGSFWVGEGLGFPWVGGDLAILVLIAAFAGVAAMLVVAARRILANAAARRSTARQPAPSAAAAQGGLGATMARELWGLFVDDGWLAAGILVVLAIAATAAHFDGAQFAPANACMVAALLMLLGASALRRAGA
jgi:hypothetical protein